MSKVDRLTERRAPKKEQCERAVASVLLAAALLLGSAAGLSGATPSDPMAQPAKESAERATVGVAPKDQKKLLIASHIKYRPHMTKHTNKLKNEGRRHFRPMLNRQPQNEGDRHYSPRLNPQPLPPASHGVGGSGGGGGGSGID